MNKVAALNLFDTAMKLVREQGRPSFDPSNNMCLYRGPDGAKCAVGMFIDDDRYEPKLEEIVLGRVVQKATTFDWNDHNTRMAIERMRRAHDRAAVTVPHANFMRHLDEYEREQRTALEKELI